MGVALEAQRTVVARVHKVDGSPPVGAGADDAGVGTGTIDLTYEESFDDLYARAYRVGYQLLGRRSEAEDVAQEALARAFVHWRKVRGYAEAWVVRVAGNVAIDAWRRSTRVESSGAPTAGASDATTPEPSSQRIDLHRALSTLSKRQREVLVLRFLADLPEADVARVLGCSAGSVKVHSARGLAALRSTMGPIQEVAS